MLSPLADLSKEFIFFTSRSSGPGGQHTNKTETKVGLKFNIMDSSLLTEDQKNILCYKFSSQLTEGKYLIITSQKHRSQFQNRKHCIDKFYQLVFTALIPERKRLKTGIPRGAHEKRLKTKKLMSERKISRRKIGRNYHE